MALELGYPHPDYLLQHLSSKQLTEWMAYFMVEPFGPRREEERLGVLASAVVQPHLKKGKKIGVDDFFPDRTKVFGRPMRRKQTWQEQMKMLMPLVKDKP